MLIILRSTFFNIFLYIWTAIIGILLSPLILTFRPKIVAFIGYIWATVVLIALRVICNIKVQIIGEEYIPSAPFIIAAKHQSAWDTIFFLKFFNNPVYILKRELTKIPIYGWHLKHMGMIAVDRKGGGAVIKKMLADVAKTIESGRILVIFPEGTRVKLKEKKAFHIGVAAIHKTYPEIKILPVALNSGLCWGKNAWTKYPGTIIAHFLPTVPKQTFGKDLIKYLEREINTHSDNLLSNCNSKSLDKY